MEQGYKPGEGRTYLKTIYEWYLPLVELEKPVIAAVNGFAFGAGLNLALAADLIIASERAQFSQVFSKVGLVPDLGGMYFLPKKIGLAKAKELVFTAKVVSAQEALDIGLVNMVTAENELLGAALSLAKQIAQGPSKALQLAKQIMNQASELSLLQLIELECYAQDLCFQTEDHQEGIKAFFEKRSPQFKGR